MLDWLACRFAPRLLDLAAVPTPELPEPSGSNDLAERTLEAFAALDASPFQGSGVTDPYRLLMGMGCSDLITREADQNHDTAGRTPNYRRAPAFQPVEIPIEGGPVLTGQRSTGAPGAPVIFVVHGLFDSHVSGYVVEYAESLRRFGFHVLALDLRDHGQLLGGAHRPSLGVAEGRDLFAAARALSRAEGVSVGLLGLSYGGQCVVRAAHEATLAGEPEVLRGGVMSVCAPLNMQRALGDFDDPSQLPRPHGLMNRAIFRELMRVMDRHLRLRPPSVRLPKHRAFEAYIREVLIPAYPEMPPLVGAFQGVARSTQASVLGAVQVPVAVLHPTDDPLVPVSHAHDARVAAGDNPYVHVRELPHGGHVGLGAVDGPGTLGLLASFFGTLRDG